MEEALGQNFIGIQQMTEIAPTVTRTGGTRAVFIDGAAVILKACIPNIHFLAAPVYEQTTLSRVPRGHHTVEHIDASVDPLNEIDGRTHPHEVTRLIHR